MSTTETEIAVLEAAEDQIRKGFTSSSYFKTTDGRVRSRGPGDDVAATCAIGGLEQGLWRATGKVNLRRHNEDQRTLYGRVLRRVNDITRRLYPKDPDGEKVTTVEEITFFGSNLAAKRRVLKVFRTAIKELKEAA